MSARTIQPAASAILGIVPDRDPREARQAEIAKKVGALLAMLRGVLDETGWTLDRLAAHLQETTGKKYDRSIVYEVLHGERPLTARVLCALPPDVHDLYTKKRAESFGCIVVKPLSGRDALEAFVAGLIGSVRDAAEAQNAETDGVSSEPRSMTITAEDQQLEARVNALSDRVTAWIARNPLENLVQLERFVSEPSARREEE